MFIVAQTCNETVQIPAACVKLLPQSCQIRNQVAEGSSCKKSEKREAITTSC